MTGYKHPIVLFASPTKFSEEEIRHAMCAEAGTIVGCATNVADLDHFIAACVGEVMWNHLWVVDTEKDEVILDWHRDPRTVWPDQDWRGWQVHALRQIAHLLHINETTLDELRRRSAEQGFEGFHKRLNVMILALATAQAGVDIMNAAARGGAS